MDNLERYYRNRDVALQRQKRYRDTHKEKIKKYHRDWSVKNKNRIIKKRLNDELIRRYNNASSSYRYHKKRLEGTDVNDPKFFYYRNNMTKHLKIFLKAQKELRERHKKKFEERLKQFNIQLPD